MLSPNRRSRARVLSDEMVAQIWRAGDALLARPAIPSPASSCLPLPDCRHARGRQRVRNRPRPAAGRALPEIDVSPPGGSPSAEPPARGARALGFSLAATRQFPPPDRPPFALCRIASSRSEGVLLEPPVAQTVSSRDSICSSLMGLLQRGDHDGACVCRGRASCESAMVKALG